jgi:hypothetical protein
MTSLVGGMEDRNLVIMDCGVSSLLNECGVGLWLAVRKFVGLPLVRDRTSDSRRAPVDLQENPKRAAREILRKMLSCAARKATFGSDCLVSCCDVRMMGSTRKKRGYVGVVQPASY